MSTVANLRAVAPEDVADLPDLPDELRVALADVATAAREGLLAMSVAVGLRVMAEMMQAEVIAKVGPKHAKLADRTASRHASAPGSVVMGGRRVPVDRPRARSVDGHEVQLESYAAFASDDLLGQVVMERMLAGLATRRHAAANEPVGEHVEAQAKATSKSAVSRRFVAQTTKTVDELLGRDLSGLRVAALMVDGVNFAEHCCVVALAITADGTKLPVGLWDGDTENAAVVTHLLADLVDRGLDASGGLLVVIDGAKALAKAVRKVFGGNALVQRCTLHKRRNVADHLPKREQGWVDRKLAAAFADRDAEAGCAPRRISPASSSRRTPARPAACVRASTTCSPCAASGCPTGSRPP